jgi:hypothetical protein
MRYVTSVCLCSYGFLYMATSLLFIYFYQIYLIHGFLYPCISPFFHLFRSSILRIYFLRYPPVLKLPPLPVCVVIYCFPYRFLTLRCFCVRENVNLEPYRLDCCPRPPSGSRTGIKVVYTHTFLCTYFSFFRYYSPPHAIVIHDSLIRITVLHCPPFFSTRQTGPSLTNSILFRSTFVHISIPFSTQAKAFFSMQFAMYFSSICGCLCIMFDITCE